MISVLIVEDDSFKRDALESMVSSAITGVNVHCVSDVASAVTAVNNAKFDVIILDMSLPSHPVVSGGGAPMSLLTGGLEILFELSSLQRDDKCIIVTQYPDIEIAGKFFPLNSAVDAIKEYFACDAIACLLYTEDSSEWKEKLSGLLKSL